MNVSADFAYLFKHKLPILKYLNWYFACDVYFINNHDYTKQLQYLIDFLKTNKFIKKSLY